MLLTVTPATAALIQRYVAQHCEIRAHGGNALSQRHLQDRALLAMMKLCQENRDATGLAHAEVEHGLE
jgi:hypothetical protein